MPLRVAVAAAVAFLALLALIVGGWGPLAAADTAISEAFRGYGGRHRGVVAFTRVATDIAVTWLYIGAGVLVTAVLLIRRRRAAALLTGAVTAVIPTIWSLMHLWLYRPRPADGFVQVDSNGFPSGHSSNAAAAVLVAVLLLRPRLQPRGRALLALAATAFALFVGLTRVVLLAHWPTDVLGGWLLALAVVPPLALLAGVPDRSGPVARW